MDMYDTLKHNPNKDQIELLEQIRYPERCTDFLLTLDKSIPFEMIQGGKILKIETFNNKQILDLITMFSELIKIDVASSSEVGIDSKYRNIKQNKIFNI